MDKRHSYPRLGRHFIIGHPVTPDLCQLALARPATGRMVLRKMGQNIHMQTATWLVSRELT